MGRRRKIKRGEISIDEAVRTLKRAGTAGAFRQLAQIGDAETTQARNFPTEEISVDLPEGRNKTRKNHTRVRQSEAWRHRRLTAMQQQAVTEMGLAWQAMTSGLGASISRYSNMPGGGSKDRFGLGADLEKTWNEWWRRAHQMRIRCAAFLDFLTEPKTAAEIERERHMKKGRGIENFCAGLDLWAEVRGWTRRTDLGLDMSHQVGH
jgi:hypothetical protein